MTSPDQNAIAMLGLGGSRLRTSAEMVPALRKGLPSKALESVSRELGMSAIAAGAMLGISGRTLARRLQTNGRFTSEESQRVFRLSRVVALATSALGSLEKARHWLQGPNRVLGEVPLHLLDTDVGADAVIEELGRIEHGVFM